MAAGEGSAGRTHARNDTPIPLRRNGARAKEHTMITSTKQRDLCKERAQEIHDRATRANRALTKTGQQDFDDFIFDVKQWDERQSFTPTSGSTGSMGGHDPRWTTIDPHVYNDPHEVGVDAPSFFKDVRASRMGDGRAMERLARNTAARGQETRAGDMTTG